MKKAALLTAFDPSAFKGGIEVYSSNLIRLLGDFQVATDVYHSGLAGGAHGFHNDYLGKLYLAGQMLKEREGDYDIIIANSFYGFGYFPPGRRTFTVYHATHAGFAEAVRERVSPASYLQLRRIYGDLCEGAGGFGRTPIAVSEGVGRELAAWYGYEGVRVVPNGVDTDLFRKRDPLLARKKWGLPEDAFIGMYAGRWEDFKGADIVEAIIRNVPDVLWIIALGTGGQQPALSGRDNVLLFEEAESDALAELYSAADFLLFPSLYEGFGYVVAEALACGLPVLSTRVGVAREVFDREPFRLLSLPDWSGGREVLLSSCAGKIELLRGNPLLREEVAKAGRRIVEEEYSLSRWRTRMAEALGL
ncbi:MAG: glycosyltransferase family 4 protein [Alphaproteobacteria bacterium]|uniref:Glycosyltransferase family 4 protein n=1 Tax=Candidatus Nitrobium versatile TaxID=2884831 RepID=A0A953M221_9BACT|nr:glycosyltransferase family 4 protein [Candidatus Nitrobium versatile]